jgi:hypothetical protein
MEKYHSHENFLWRNFYIAGIYCYVNTIKYHVIVAITIALIFNGSLKNAKFTFRAFIVLFTYQKAAGSFLWI